MGPLISSLMAGLLAMVLAAGPLLASEARSDAAGRSHTRATKSTPGQSKPKSLAPPAAKPRMSRPGRSTPGAPKQSTPNMDHVVGEELC